MSRRPARFTQADVRRALKAAGSERAVEILPDGAIRLVPFTGKHLTAANGSDELEEELREFRARCESEH